MVHYKCSYKLSCCSSSSSSFACLKCACGRGSQNSPRSPRWITGGKEKNDRGKEGRKEGGAKRKGRKNEGKRREGIKEKLKVCLRRWPLAFFAIRWNWLRRRCNVSRQNETQERDARSWQWLIGLFGWESNYDWCLAMLKRSRFECILIDSSDWLINWLIDWLVPRHYSRMFHFCLRRTVCCCQPVFGQLTASMQQPCSIRLIRQLQKTARKLIIMVACSTIACIYLDRVKLDTSTFANSCNVASTSQRMSN